MHVVGVDWKRVSNFNLNWTTQSVSSMDRADFSNSVETTCAHWWGCGTRASCARGAHSKVPLNLAKQVLHRDSAEIRHRHHTSAQTRRKQASTTGWATWFNPLLWQLAAPTWWLVRCLQDWWAGLSVCMVWWRQFGVQSKRMVSRSHFWARPHTHCIVPARTSMKKLTLEIRTIIAQKTLPDKGTVRKFRYLCWVAGRVCGGGCGWWVLQKTRAWRRGRSVCSVGVGFWKTCSVTIMINW